MVNRTTTRLWIIAKQESLLTAVVKTCGHVVVHLVTESKPHLYTLASDVPHNTSDILCNVRVDLGKGEAYGHHTCNHDGMREGSVLEDGKELDAVIGIWGGDR